MRKSLTGRFNELCALYNTDMNYYKELCQRHPGRKSQQVHDELTLVATRIHETTASITTLLEEANVFNGSDLVSGLFPTIWDGKPQVRGKHVLDNACQVIYSMILCGAIEMKLSTEVADA